MLWDKICSIQAGRKPAKETHHNCSEPNSAGFPIKISAAGISYKHPNGQTPETGNVDFPIIHCLTVGATASGNLDLVLNDNNYSVGKCGKKTIKDHSNDQIFFLIARRRKPPLYVDAKCSTYEAYHINNKIRNIMCKFICGYGLITEEQAVEVCAENALLSCEIRKANTQND